MKIHFTKIKDDLTPYAKKLKAFISTLQGENSKLEKIHLCVGLERYLDAKIDISDLSSINLDDETQSFNLLVELCFSISMFEKLSSKGVIARLSFIKFKNDFLSMLFKGTLELKNLKALYDKYQFSQENLSKLIVCNGPSKPHREKITDAISVLSESKPGDDILTTLSLIGLRPLYNEYDTKATNSLKEIAFNYALETGNKRALQKYNMYILGGTFNKCAPGFLENLALISQQISPLKITAHIKYKAIENVCKIFLRSETCRRHIRRIYKRSNMQVHDVMSLMLSIASRYNLNINSSNINSIHITELTPREQYVWNDFLDSYLQSTFIWLYSNYLESDIWSKSVSEQVVINSQPEDKSSQCNALSLSMTDKGVKITSKDNEALLAYKDFNAKKEFLLHLKAEGLATETLLQKIGLEGIEVGDDEHYFYVNSEKNKNQTKLGISEDPVEKNLMNLFYRRSGLRRPQSDIDAGMRFFTLYKLRHTLSSEELSGTEQFDKDFATFTKMCGNFAVKSEEVFQLVTIHKLHDFYATYILNKEIEFLGGKSITLETLSSSMLASLSRLSRLAVSVDRIIRRYNLQDFQYKLLSMLLRNIVSQDTVTAENKQALTTYIRNHPWLFLHITDKDLTNLSKVINLKELFTFITMEDKNGYYTILHSVFSTPNRRKFPTLAFLIDKGVVTKDTLNTKFLNSLYCIDDPYPISLNIFENIDSMQFLTKKGILTKDSLTPEVLSSGGHPENLAYHIFHRADVNTRLPTYLVNQGFLTKDNLTSQVLNTKGPKGNSVAFEILTKPKLSVYLINNGVLTKDNLTSQVLNTKDPKDNSLAFEVLTRPKLSVYLINNGVLTKDNLTSQVLKTKNKLSYTLAQVMLSNSDIAKALIEKQVLTKDSLTAELLNTKNDYGHCALHIIFTQHEIAKSLIERKLITKDLLTAEFLNTKGYSHTGSTLAHYILLRKDFAKYLIDIGFLTKENLTTKVLNFQNNKGRTPLHIILMQDEIAQSLIERNVLTKEHMSEQLLCTIDKNDFGDTLAHYILQRKDFAKYLIDKGFLTKDNLTTKVLNFQNNKERTPLHIILGYTNWSFKQSDIAQSLIERNVITKDHLSEKILCKRDKSGYTLAHQILVEGSTKLLTTLISKKLLTQENLTSKLLNTKNKNRDTLALNIFRKPHLSNILLNNDLLTKDNVTLEVLNKRGRNHNTLVHTIFDKWAIWSRRNLELSFNITKAVVEKGLITKDYLTAKVLSRQNASKYSVAEKIFKTDMDQAKFLIEKGLLTRDNLTAQVLNTQNINKYSVAHYLFERPALVKLLTEKGVLTKDNLTAQVMSTANKKGNTIARYLFNQSEVARNIVDHGGGLSTKKRKHRGSYSPTTGRIKDSNLAEFLIKRGVLTKDNLTAEILHTQYKDSDTIASHIYRNQTLLTALIANKVLPNDPKQAQTESISSKAQAAVMSSKGKAATPILYRQLQHKRTQDEANLDGSERAKKAQKK